MNTKYSIIVNSFLIILMVVFVHLNTADWPKVIGECCNESIFAFQEDDEIAANCSEKFGVSLKHNDSLEMDFESYLCFMDCVFSDGDILVNNSINMENVKADIMSLTENSTELGNIMIESVEECNRLLNYIIFNLRRNPESRLLFQGKCSPTAFIVSDCAAMEYYINCPDKYWTPTAECEARKFYSLENRFTRL